MGYLDRVKGFIRGNIVLVVSIPAIGALHWIWWRMQYNDLFVAAHERREFPPITLYKHAKYLVGLGEQPPKHPPP